MSSKVDIQPCLINNHWSLRDTTNINIGCQDQKHFPLVQYSLEKDITSDSLST
jgi:hypothetical protein